MVKGKKSTLVAIVMGSDSDLPVMKQAGEALDKFEIGYEIKVLSAHRTPVEAAKYAAEARSRGIRVIIAGAGGAAHLAGAVAAQTELPEALREYYRKNYFAVYNGQHAQIERAAEALVEIYNGNIFPAMNVTWGTYPNNLGHSDFPGCFRCHDGNHKAKDGRVITQDCNACHNLLAMEPLQ